VRGPHLLAGKIMEKHIKDEPESYIPECYAPYMPAHLLQFQQITPNTHRFCMVLADPLHSTVLPAWPQDLPPLEGSRCQGVPAKSIHSLSQFTVLVLHEQTA
jgi:hypothetical protein